VALVALLVDGSMAVEEEEVGIAAADLPKTARRRFRSCCCLCCNGTYSSDMPRTSNCWIGRLGVGVE
jgi:hypothetical protein